jgi:predicted transcriptional regulator
VKQQSLFSETLPYAKGSKTSKAAAKSAQSSAQTTRAKILAYISKRGAKGATCDEIEAKLNLPHQTASARVFDLKKAASIRDTGSTRATRSGRQATVYASV